MKRYIKRANGTTFPGLRGGLTIREAIEILYIRGHSFRDIMLPGADLRGISLANANFTRAQLIGVDLSGADLSGVDFCEADLEGAVFSRATLRNTFFGSAHMAGVTLTGATLSGACLRGANLTGAIGLEELVRATRILPETGPVVGWKKCRKNVIVKLLISSGTRRSSAFGRKCRAESVEVLELSKGTEAVSQYDSTTRYRVGEIVTAPNFDPNFKNECAGGIHFYLTREEAEEN